MAGVFIKQSGGWRQSVPQGVPAFSTVYLKQSGAWSLGNPATAGIAWVKIAGQWRVESTLAP